MTLTRLFVCSQPATTPEAARTRALRLYKEWLREIPRAIRKYPLDISVAAGRARMRAVFERYRGISDLRATNQLLLFWTNELIETHNIWKQKTHVMRLFDPPAVEQEAERERARIAQSTGRRVSPFLEKFLSRP